MTSPVTVTEPSASGEDKKNTPTSGKSETEHVANQTNPTD